MTESPGLRECDSEAATVDDLLVQLKQRYEQRGDQAAWGLEEPFWRSILSNLISEPGGVSFNYRIQTLLGVGGAGAVFRVVDCNLFSDLPGTASTPKLEKQKRSYRALKVPRPHLEKGPGLAGSLRDEISRLSALSHPNVVSLYAKGQIELSIPTGTTTWPWYIMSYLHNAQDLEQVCLTNCPDLYKLTHFLYDVAKGLQYTHASGIIHCDVKPANIFVTTEQLGAEQPRGVLADFGYAKHLRGPTAETTVGFTEYFAHPELLMHAIKSSRQSRTFTKLFREAIRPAFDLFALGMTIHHLIETYYKSYQVYKQYSYEIKYLQLMAARLLDGLNHQRGITAARLPFYCFRDCGAPGHELYVAGLRYTRAAEVVEDFEKLLGKTTPEYAIPELIESRRENIQVSDVAPAVLTERLARIIEHPILKRLSSATQLGLARLLYPGATHSRMEHAIGTFGVASKYIRSLYHDRLDPLFRQMVGVRTMKATLLAALLHDIGQYPLAHDLEDVSLEFFSHERFGKRLLQYGDEAAPILQDAKITPELKAFRSLLKDDWEVDLHDITRILNARSSDDQREGQVGSHVERICKSLIDGPIDVDKVDYLQRDSRHCNVQYGYGIDFVRLLKCLTVAHDDIKEGHLLSVIGVHEKGRVSAESVLFARYALLTQVYWHHTMRALKALLHIAAAEFLHSVAEGNVDRMREEFFRYVIMEETQVDQEWQQQLKLGGAVAEIHSGDLRVLGWLWRNTTERGRRAIARILDRDLFARVIVVYRSELNERQRKTLDKVYQPEGYHDRCLLRDNCEAAILQRLKRSAPSARLLETEGYSAESWPKRLEEPDQVRCLVDYPALRLGSSFGLQVVRQWGDKPAQSGRDVDTPSESYPKLIPEDHFRDGMKELEKSLACLRVYWCPEEQLVVKETIGAEGIKEVVLAEISRFVLRR